MSGRLLVVDDNEMNRDLLSRRLVRAGYEVMVAEDGSQALNLFVDHNFDLVLLDVMMPVMDGITVLGLLRRTYSMLELPVIMVTAKDETDDIVSALKQGANDYVTKPISFPVVLARVETHLSAKQSSDRIKGLAGELEKRNEFIRSVFGRYVSSEVVESLLDNPQGLGFDGEHRQVTILIADLRGFTLLANTLPPDVIVSLLNNYLETMIEVIGSYHGTISEIVGDGVLAFFGAPVPDENHASNAVACAIAMQIAMQHVNKRNREKGLMELQMGIGINSGEGIVGNIGSKSRSKYAVVGSVINLASRIEGRAAGHQILLSEATLNETGDIIRVDSRQTILPKGSIKPVNIYEVSGIGAGYNLFLDKHDDKLCHLTSGIPVDCTLMDGKMVSGPSFKGEMVRLSPYQAHVLTSDSIEVFSDVRIQFRYKNGHLYGKVVEIPAGENHLLITFSSLSPDASDLIFSLIGTSDL